MLAMERREEELIRKENCFLRKECQKYKKIIFLLNEMNVLSENTFFRCKCHSIFDTFLNKWFQFGQQLQELKTRDEVCDPWPQKDATEVIEMVANCKQLLSKREPKRKAKRKERKSEKEKKENEKQVFLSRTKRLQCQWPGCDAMFRDREDLENHKWRHTGNKLYACDWPGCQKSFSSRCYLKKHHSTHENPHVFKCLHQQCQHAFVTSAELNAHFAEHHFARKPFRCEFADCGQEFAVKRNLKDHQIVHIDEKRFTCDWPGRSGQKYTEEGGSEAPKPVATQPTKTPKRTETTTKKETTAKKKAVKDTEPKSESKTESKTEPKSESRSESAPKRSRRAVVAEEEKPTTSAVKEKRGTRSARNAEPVVEAIVEPMRKSRRGKAAEEKSEAPKVEKSVAKKANEKPTKVTAKRNAKKTPENAKEVKEINEELNEKSESKTSEEVIEETKSEEKEENEEVKEKSEEVEEKSEELAEIAEQLDEKKDEIIEEKSDEKIEESKEEKTEEKEEKMDLSSETVTSLKRKEMDESEESSKRQKVSRFSVPSIPRVCGQLFSLGEEIAGELGLRQKRVKETKVKDNEPSPVTDKEHNALDHVVAVVCGAMHSCCLTSEGKVLTFGCNDDSALGRDTLTSLDATDDSLDLDESEERECRTPRQVAGLPEVVVKMTAGDMHTCVLCADGSVWVWGNFKDESKKFGLFSESARNGDDFEATRVPKRVNIAAKVVDIASGCHHILLLSEEGRVFSFGEGSKGQLGRIGEDRLQALQSNRALFLDPQEVSLAADVVVEKVWASHWSSYALTSAGHVMVWGLNNYHQLGFRSEGFVEVVNCDQNESQTSLKLIVELEPVRCPNAPSDVRQIANGQHHVIALDAEGRVFACGSNTYSKLGFKTEVSADHTVDTFTRIDALDGVCDIACGEFCSLAVTIGGDVLSWGQGSKHIGSADFQDIETPTKVSGHVMASTKFVSASSGSQHSLLIGFEREVNGN
ncbi:unnamed protein product [Medioppia subpectinata]|uniref:C2H2-type domain-containing protein n=1 Tax=Medioppia subpectinata TaxID=1979941 RepID=A0A7R9Q3R0_9ACAR|nr:unnamed protein product [Medioppia subpectinata]CAG2111539.1 unnamed protein product [Medioppia subpectinata]